MFKALLVALTFFLSGIALASTPDFGPNEVISTFEMHKMDADAAGRLGEMPFDTEFALFDEQVCGNRLFVEYSKGGFTNVTQVQNWCGTFMTQFNIVQERFNDHCGWSRSGSYGRYNYSGIFIYAVEYSGAPRFYFERYCDGGNGGSGGGY